MANTTNYNWETPDDTDLVKDGAAAIRTLGNSIDTTTKNLNPETTTGDIAYRSATANTNTRLPIGTTGQVLTVAAGVPSWATPAGGGKVLQVVYADYATETTVATTSYTDTGLTATITPSATNSKVLVIVSQQGYATRTSNSDPGFGVKLLRGATTIFDAAPQGYQSLYANNANIAGSAAFSYLDSPSTTSATTYKIQGRSYLSTNSGQVKFQVESGRSSITLLEIGA